MNSIVESKPEVVVKNKTSIKKPSQYNVIFFNDNITPFEFVFQVLVTIFNKSEDDALNLTMKVHHEGKSIVGVYPKEIALTKKEQTTFNAERLKFPLLCEVEKAED